MAGMVGLAESKLQHHPDHHGVEKVLQEPGPMSPSAAQQTHGLDKQPQRHWDFIVFSNMCVSTTVSGNLLSCLGDRRCGTLRVALSAEERAAAGCSMGIVML